MSERPDSMLMYGATGVGKTAQIGEIAEWEWGRTGGVTRLISADSGWDPIEEKVSGEGKALGTEYAPGKHVCIEAWNIQYLPNPFPVLIKLSEGFWPALAPDGKRLVMTAPKKTDGRIHSMCGKFPVTQLAVEGLSTISAMLMQDHIRNLRKIAEDIVGDFVATVEVETGGKLTTETLKFGKSGRAHYGHIQDFVLLDLVPRFATLPVSRVIWTAHEAKGTDDITGIKDSVLGPATIGKAAVDRTAMKFGDTLHFQIVPESVIVTPGRPPMERASYRAYYEPHADPVLTRMPWPAKLSLPLDRVEALRKAFPGGYVPLTPMEGITKFLEFKLGSSAAPPG